MKTIKKILVLVLLVLCMTGCAGNGTGHRITFKTNGGSEIAAVEVEAGVVPTKPADPEKEGFKFVGWYSDEELTKEYDFSEALKKSIILYAKWAEYFTVSFETNCNETIEDVEVLEGEKVQKPDAIENGDLTLLGWYTDSNFSEQYDFNNVVSKDLVLYAKWVDTTEVFTVVFNTGNAEKIDEELVVYGNKVTMPKQLQTLSHKVVGWYLDAEYTVEYDFTEDVYGDLELFAKWEQYVYILSASANRNWVTYKNNIKEQSNKKIEFVDRTSPYVVGDDNGWRVLPVFDLGVVNAEGDGFDDFEGNWSFTYKVYELVEGVYVLSDENLVDSFDKEKGIIDFSSSAIGKNLKVEIIPENLTKKQSQADAIGDYIVSYTCLVVDGFNAYTAKDLAYLENRTADEEDKAAWDAFKLANGIDVNYSPANVLVHANIQITSSDLPKEFFYNEGDADLLPTDSDYARTLGSLRDYTDLFTHQTKDNENFEFIGNYFNIDIQKLSVVTRENGDIKPEGESISHSVLFRLAGSENSYATIKNMSFLGNAPRVEDKIKSGGLILIQVQNPKALITNTISSGFFISFFPELTDQPVVLEKSKAYDSFNSFLYNWGSKDFTVRDCEFSGAGGPVLIEDHVDPTAADGGKPASTKFINCNLESYVAGSEGWFTTVKATALVPLIKQLDQVLNAYGKSFLKTNSEGVTYMNFLSVIKSGSAQTLTADKIKGYLSYDEDVFNFGEGNPYLSAVLDAAYTQGAPVFQGDKVEGVNGFGVFNGTYLLDATQQPIQDPTNNIFTGDKICIYYNGMAIVFELYPVGQAYNPAN